MSERVLYRLVDALERIATADERRNELLVADQAERREAQARWEAQQARAIERIVGPSPAYPDELEARAGAT